MNRKQRRENRKQPEQHNQKSIQSGHPVSVITAASEFFVDANHSSNYLYATAVISSNAVAAIRKKVDGKVQSE